MKKRNEDILIKRQKTVEKEIKTVEIDKKLHEEKIAAEKQAIEDEYKRLEDERRDFALAVGNVEDLNVRLQEMITQNDVRDR